MNKTKKFIDCAFSVPPDQGAKCPCSKCRNALCEDKMLKRLKSIMKKLFRGKSMAYNLFQGCSTATSHRAKMMKHMDPSLVGPSICSQRDEVIILFSYHFPICIY
jgi:hypothetical protein